MMEPDAFARGLVGKIVDVKYETMKEHYCDFMTSGPILVLKLEGDNAISVMRKLQSQIREDWVNHASDTPEEAHRELTSR